MPGQGSIIYLGSVLCICPTCPTESVADHAYTRTATAAPYDSDSAILEAGILWLSKAKFSLYSSLHFCFTPSFIELPGYTKKAISRSCIALLAAMASSMELLGIGGIGGAPTCAAILRCCGNLPTMLSYNAKPVKPSVRDATGGIKLPSALMSCNCKSIQLCAAKALLSFLLALAKGVTSPDREL